MGEPALTKGATLLKATVKVWPGEGRLQSARSLASLACERAVASTRRELLLPHVTDTMAWVFNIRGSRRGGPALLAPICLKVTSGKFSGWVCPGPGAGPGGGPFASPGAGWVTGAGPGPSCSSSSSTQSVWPSHSPPAMVSVSVCQ